MPPGKGIRISLGSNARPAALYTDERKDSNDKSMDRKELIRKYKNTPRPMGVFCVRNKLTSKVLVGSSVDLPAMLNRLRFQLQHGSHPNRWLQKDWNDLGAEAFTIEELDTLPPSEQPGYDPSEDLQTLEQMWRQKLSRSRELYEGQTAEARTNK